MERGAVSVIAEGCEAGGHIGELTSMVLWPDIARARIFLSLRGGGI
jgi:enoyl-[acyl-carrier protein] reductase II